MKASLLTVAALSCLANSAFAQTNTLTIEPSPAETPPVMVSTAFGSSLPDITIEDEASATDEALDRFEPAATSLDSGLPTLLFQTMPAANNSLVAGGGEATVTQKGDNNRAEIRFSGALGGSGEIQQIGNRNTGTLEVSDGARGRIVQKGDDNSLGLSVAGIGTDVSYTQIGNGLSLAPELGTPAGSGVGVFSNGGSVSITQYAMPGIGQ